MKMMIKNFLMMGLMILLIVPFGLGQENTSENETMTEDDLLLINDDVDKNLFIVDLNDTFTIIFMFLIFISSLALSFYYSSLVGGLILSLFGFILMFNAFNILVSSLVVIIGITLIFGD